MVEEGRHMFLAGHCSLVAKSCLTLFETPRTVACLASLSMGFPRQEYWSGLPLPSPRDLPNPGIEPVSPALAGRFFTTEPPGQTWGDIKDHSTVSCKGATSVQGLPRWVEGVSWRERYSLQLIAGFWLPKPGGLSVGDLGGWEIPRLFFETSSSYTPPFVVICISYCGKWQLLPPSN